MGGVTLDAGALIGLDRNNRKIITLLRRALERGDTVYVPGPVLAQAIRHPARQARLGRMIRQANTEVVPLDRVDAVRVGRLLAASGTSDVVDAHVVVCARRTATAVVTSDPDDIQRLDGGLQVVKV